MEIFDVISSIRTDLLELKLEQARLQTTVSLLEGFTWNLLRDLRDAIAEGEVTVTFEDDDPPSTVDSPERTDDEPTLF